jgi:hypothetical protein
MLSNYRKSALNTKCFATRLLLTSVLLTASRRQSASEKPIFFINSVSKLYYGHSEVQGKRLYIIKGKFR